MNKPNEYENLALDYDRRWKHYVGVTTQRTLDALELGGDERVLDVGCGTGVLLERLKHAHPGLDLSGIDPTNAMLARAKERCAGGVEIRQGNAEALPYPDEQFDEVVSVNALHCFSDSARAVGEIGRVLRPGGTAVLTDWCGDFWTMRLFAVHLRARGGTLERLLGTGELRQVLEDAGFEAKRTERFRIRPLWGMMLLKAQKPGPPP